MALTQEAKLAPDPPDFTPPRTEESLLRNVLLANFHRYSGYNFETSSSAPSTPKGSRGKRGDTSSKCKSSSAGNSPVPTRKPLVQNIDKSQPPLKFKVKTKMDTSAKLSSAPASPRGRKEWQKKGEIMSADKIGSDSDMEHVVNKKRKAPSPPRKLMYSNINDGLNDYDTSSSSLLIWDGERITLHGGNRPYPCKKSKSQHLFKRDHDCIGEIKRCTSDPLIVVSAESSESINARIKRQRSAMELAIHAQEKHRVPTISPCRKGKKTTEKLVTTWPVKHSSLRSFDKTDEIKTCKDVSKQSHMDVAQKLISQKEKGAQLMIPPLGIRRLPPCEPKAADGPKQDKRESSTVMMPLSNRERSLPTRLPPSKAPLYGGIRVLPTLPSHISRRAKPPAPPPPPPPRVRKRKRSAPSPPVRPLTVKNIGAFLPSVVRNEEVLKRLLEEEEEGWNREGDEQEGDISVHERWRCVRS